MWRYLENVGPPPAKEIRTTEEVRQQKTNYEAEKRAETDRRMEEDDG